VCAFLKKFERINRIRMVEMISTRAIELEGTSHKEYRVLVEVSQRSHV